MNFYMAKTTQRYHIKRLGIIGVVVFLRLIATETNQSIRAWQLTGSGSVIDCIMRFLYLWVFFIVTFLATVYRDFSFCGFRISRIKNSPTWVAVVLKAVFFGSIFAKFLSGFNFLAMVASFCYDGLRHDFLLNRKLCLEPFTSLSCVWLVLLYKYIANTSTNKYIFCRITYDERFI